MSVLVREKAESSASKLYRDSGSNFTYIEPGILSRSGTVLSLFSGAGGFDLGLEQACFETVGCIEMDPNCRATLAFNRPQWKLFDGDGAIPGDVRSVDPAQVLANLGMKRGVLDLVVGGPPCQPFSNLGKKTGSDDERNGDLYAEYVRMVTGFLPKGFIFENVEGLAQARHNPVREYLFRELSGLGYGLTSHVFTSADYGDPQIRKRFVILGILNVETVAIPLPQYFESESKRDQLFRRIGKDLRSPVRLWRTLGDTLETIPTERLQRADCIQMGVSEIVERRMRFVKPGENFRVVPHDQLPACWTSGKHQGHDTFGRLRSDRPSVTIRTSAYNASKGRFIHPTENRGLNTAEMAALQSFPHDFEFKCAGKPTLVGIGRMIGNAVPVNLARALGGAMIAQLPR